MPKKGELGQFAGLRGGLAKKKGWCFGGGLIVQCTLCHGRKKNKVGKDYSNEPDDGLQMNQNCIWKEIDEVEEDDDETIVILTDHQRLKTRLKDNKEL